MTHSGKTQKGFALFEGLLIIIIIAVIGGIGWYAIHTKHQTDKILSQADKISQSTPIKSLTGSSDSSSTQQKYFTIAQWGVRAPYSGSLHLQYDIQVNPTDQEAGFTSAELISADSNCSKFGGSITRMSGDTNAPMTEDQTIAQVAKTNPAIVHIGNYYYFFTHDQQGCSEKQNAMDLQEQTNNSVKALVSNLETIPQ